MKLRDKTVIVTGAARGIGRGIAESFAREGANLVVADLGSLAAAASSQWAYGLAGKEQLEAAAGEIAELGGRAISCEVDVTQAASCRALADVAARTFGSIDVLVNNAGLVKSGPIDSYSEQDFDRLFDVNVKGVFLGTQACLSALADGGGAIINIASVAGKRGYPGMAVYCASKFAVIGMTQSMAAEFARRSVRVNAICPGILPTAMWTDHLTHGLTGGAADEDGQAYQGFVQQTTPLGRQQLPEDIGEAALYLARADNVTGVSLNVAGGMEMS